MSAKVCCLGVALGLVVQLAHAEPAPGDRACAAYDIHVLTLLEEHAAAEELEPSALANIAQAMIDARLACRLGDYQRALALYAAADPGKPIAPPLRLADGEPGR